MKTKLFFILIAGFAFSVLSCNSDSEGTTKEDKTTGTLYAVGTRVESEEEPTSADSDKPYPDPGEYDPNTPHKPIVEYPSLELVFTGDDIKLFNITSGEIVFTDLIIEKLTTPTEEGIYRKLSLYYDDKPLFEEIQIVSAVMSYAINDLVFIYNPRIYDKNEAGYLAPSVYRYSDRGFLIEPKYYLVDGYPIIEDGETWNYHGAEGVLDQDGVRRLRDENFKKRKAEWDIFIKYLRDTGKIVE
ncbi:MAG: hypothetical protein LBK58_15135 [Prevotellaceae bacterium]|jgi:hypothetical protein|nr:hypothetical protein [Prevotellaceae bacterium]